MFNKYHQIYIDIFSDSEKTIEENKQIIEEVERLIAYSTTNVNTLPNIIMLQKCHNLH